MIRVRDGSRGGGLMVSFGKMMRGSRGVGGLVGKLGGKLKQGRGIWRPGRIGVGKLAAWED